MKQQELSLTADGNANGTARDFPGGPVVKNLPSNEGGTGWIPGPELIGHVPCGAAKQNKTRQKNCSSPWACKIHLFKSSTMIYPSPKTDLENCLKLVSFSLFLFFSRLGRVWLFCDPMDCSLPDSFVHGISQASRLIAFLYYKVILSQLSFYFHFNAMTLLQWSEKANFKEGLLSHFYNHVLISCRKILPEMWKSLFWFKKFKKSFFYKMLHAWAKIFQDPLYSLWVGDQEKLHFLSWCCIYTICNWLKLISTLVCVCVCVCVCVLLVTQSCPTLRNPMDCSSPGSSIHGIL